MNDSIERSVTHEQVNTLFKSIGALAIINLTVGAALTSLFWKVVPHALLLSWMGAIVVMIAIRIAMYRSYSRHFQPNKLERYQNFLVLGSLKVTEMTSMTEAREFGLQRSRSVVAVVTLWLLCLLPSHFDSCVCCGCSHWRKRTPTDAFIIITFVFIVKAIQVGSQQ